MKTCWLALWMCITICLHGTYEIRMTWPHEAVFAQRWWRRVSRHLWGCVCTTCAKTCCSVSVSMKMCCVAYMKKYDTALWRRVCKNYVNGILHDLYEGMFAWHIRKYVCTAFMKTMSCYMISPPWVIPKYLIYWLVQTHSGKAGGDRVHQVENIRLIWDPEKVDRDIEGSISHFCIIHPSSLSFMGMMALPNLSSLSISAFSSPLSFFSFYFFSPPSYLPLNFPFPWGWIQGRNLYV